jgi:hypothetical protein
MEFIIGVTGVIVNFQFNCLYREFGICFSLAGREAKMKEEKDILGLSTVRRNRGITLQQISETTKIGVRSLAAIETGDFRVLPGGIYATSYIRQYARAIDYPEDDILEVYRRHMSQPAPSQPVRGGNLPGGLRPTTAST